MKIVVKNYRTFTRAKPLAIEMKNGITAIVGPNNSGKSCILKFFYEFRNLFEHFKQENNYLQRPSFSINFLGVRDQSDVFSRLDQGDIEIEFIFKNLKIKTKILKAGNTTQATEISFSNSMSINEKNTTLSSLNLKLKNHILIDLKTGGEILNFNEINDYFKKLSNCLYIPAFRNIVNIGGRNNFFDIDIGENFIEKWQSLKAGTSSANRDAAILVEKDLKEIFNYHKFTVTSSIAEKDMMININDKSYRLNEMGSGLAQFILVFINAATKKPSFILIDEPESNLHPKLQIDFINRLLRYTSCGMIFATHNIGLAESVAHVIYSCQRSDINSPTTIKPFQKTQNMHEFLGELNFSNFPSLGFKKVLLVEGPTDLNIFHAFLRKKQKYKNFLVFPLGGDSLINFEGSKILKELYRLGKVKVYCWIDSEKKSRKGTIKKNRKDFESGCKKLKFKIKLSDLRSIENYFPLNRIQEIYPNIKSLGPYQSLPSGWNKGNNWRIAENMDLEELKGTDLYSFLNDICK